MNDFGKYLKELRGNRSLREMERITGLSHTYLSTLEKGMDPRSGKERKPTPETLKKLSETLEVSYIQLMKRAGYVVNIQESGLMEATEKIILSATSAMEIEKEIHLLNENLDKLKEELKKYKVLKTTNKDKNFTENIDGINNQIENTHQKISSLDEQLKSIRLNQNFEIEHINTSFNRWQPQMQEAVKEYTYRYTLEIPFYKKSKNGLIDEESTKEDADLHFYDIRNLLYLDASVNYKGKILSVQDIEKILSKIEEMKAEFEYED